MFGNKYPDKKLHNWDPKLPNMHRFSTRITTITSFVGQSSHKHVWQGCARIQHMSRIICCGGWQTIENENMFIFTGLWDADIESWWQAIKVGCKKNPTWMAPDQILIRSMTMYASGLDLIWKYLIWFIYTLKKSDLSHLEVNILFGSLHYILWMSPYSVPPETQDHHYSLRFDYYIIHEP